VISLEVLHHDDRQGAFDSRLNAKSSVAQSRGRKKNATAAMAYCASSRVPSSQFVSPSSEL
jgi:hypothetical protein